MATDISNNIKWVTAPPVTPLGKRERFVAALQERPGDWAIYPASSVNGAATTGTAFRKRGCETRVYEGTLYVRWPVSA